MCMVNNLLFQNKIQKDENGWTLYTASGTHPLILWETTQGKANKGRRRLNYVDVLKKRHWSPREGRDKNHHAR